MRNTCACNASLHASHALTHAWSASIRPAHGRRNDCIQVMPTNNVSSQATLLGSTPRLGGTTDTRNPMVGACWERPGTTLVKRLTSAAAQRPRLQTHKTTHALYWFIPNTFAHITLVYRHHHKTPHITTQGPEAQRRHTKTDSGRCSSMCSTCTAACAGPLLCEDAACTTFVQAVHQRRKAVGQMRIKGTA